MPKRYKKRKSKGLFFLTLCMFSLLLITGVLLSYKISVSYKELAQSAAKQPSNEKNTEAVTSNEISSSKNKDDTIKKDPSVTEIVVNSVGDCTIGNDDKFSYENSLPAMLRKQNSDYSYFFKNVADIFKNDDITTANLETTFTTATSKADKQFTFKAPPEFAKTLSLGGIEAVNLSNNHIYDYLNKGFQDTMLSLKNENINYFGEKQKWSTEVKGYKFAFLGYQAFYYDAAFLKALKTDIQAFKSQNYIVIINFHWGEENAYEPNPTQKYIGHYAIDNGADLVIGHHPHVMQGIENYKNKFIAYSMGNFCFGGNSNPYDKDTFILQSKFQFKDNKCISIGIKPIACSISSTDSYNDYCPTPAANEKKDIILNKLNKLSKAFETQLKDDFLFVDQAS